MALISTPGGVPVWPGKGSGLPIEMPTFTFRGFALAIPCTASTASLTGWTFGETASLTAGMSLRFLKRDVARLAAQSTHSCGFTADGLPIGLQIVGRPFDEETVLKACHAFESATDYHLRKPQLPGLGD